MNTVKPVVSVVAVAALATLSGCGVGEASVADRPTAEAFTPLPVETTHPYRADIFATYEATAAITTDADAAVVARVGGELVELLVEEGDRVEAGQVLARLDGRRLRLEMLAAKADLERISREYRRNIDLHERGLISTSMFEGLEFDLAALQASYKLKQLNYDYSNIRAPIDGVVASREIKQGQNVSVGDITFRITETTELLAYLQIPQVELPKFEAGCRATLAVASMPDVEFEAMITRISPTIDARSGTFRATVQIQNPSGMLAPGMFGRFTIAYDQHADALLIPAVALLDEGDQPTVYVVRDGVVNRRVVETGIEADGDIEILEGLDENEQVVVAGHGGLRTGSRVLASSALPDRSSG